MNRFLSIIATANFTILVTCISFAQNIYIYPNKRLADQGLIEYRRYTLEEARAYQQGGSFEPYLTTLWSTERQLTQNQEPEWTQVITSGDSIFCSYFTIEGHWAYFIGSNNNGVDWTECRYMGDSTISGTYMFPSIIKNNNQILVGFKIQQAPYGEDLFYRISPDAGTTWGPLRRILGYWQYNFYSFSSATNSGSTIYWVYNEGNHDSLYVIKSTDFGTSWNGRGTPIAYLNDTPQCMTARASANTVHVLWVNEDSPVSVRYSRSTNNGQTWSPEIDISQDSLGAQLCKVTVDGNHVVISWMGYKYSPYMFTGDIFVKQSFDGGITWDGSQTLTDLHMAMSSGVHARDSLLVATWQDLRFGGDNAEIMVRTSINNGINWSYETRLSYGDFYSDSPEPISTTDRIHILWGDRREVNPGLYYSFGDIFDDIDNELLPDNYLKLSAYPNPFNSSIILKYPLHINGQLKIYNVGGQLIQTLNHNEKEVQYTWDGKDNNGQPLSSGVYLIVVKTPLGQQHTKITYLK